MTTVDWGRHFRYEAGRLFWKVRRGPKAAPGDEAGSIKTDGRYKSLFIRGKRYYVHRVVWEIHNGSIPAQMCIDHINGDGLDNRIENLRMVTRSINQRNRKLSKNNRTGVIGVSHHGNAFVASVGGRYLGRFPSIEQAAISRMAAESAAGFIIRKG